MAEQDQINDVLTSDYQAGFVTDIESDSLPAGLTEQTVREISRIKGEPEFLLEWRLQAYHHWLTLETPEWAHVNYPEIDYQDISYYSAPKKKTDGPKSLDEVDPELLRTYEKLGSATRRTSTISWCSG